jgi:hypothetical protein
VDPDLISLKIRTVISGLGKFGGTQEKSRGCLWGQNSHAHRYLQVEIFISEQKAFAFPGASTILIGW